MNMQKKTLLLAIGAVLLLVVIMASGWVFLTPRSSGNAATPASNCLNCHSDKERLKTFADRYQQVYVDPAQIAQQVHGGLACTTCHGGDPTKDTPEEACLNGKAYKDPAATKVVAKTCGNCHPEITARHVKSLHATLDGIRTALVDLLGEKEGTFRFEATCSDCHASCSGCHMETPDRRNVLYARAENHHFEARSESKNCAACHTGMGDTFFGEKNKPEHGPSLMARAGMQCVDCHGDKDVHGSGIKTTFSMESPKPHCDDCHRDPTRRVVLGDTSRVAPQYVPSTAAHAIHNEAVMSCEACHTQWYPSCWNCHNGRTDKTVYELFLGVSPLTKKIQPIAHSPATSGAGASASSDIQGGWAIKSRHSWGAAHSCETCHTQSDIYVDAEGRKAPFVGYWTPKRANGQFVDEKRVQGLIIDANKFKQDVHKNTKCNDCHASLADNVCTACHNKTQKSGKTVLSPAADWSRQNYIAVRETLTNAQELIAQAKTMGINVTTWERDWKNLKDNYLQISNEFHGNPGSAQIKMKTLGPDSQTFARTLQTALAAQPPQNQNLPAALLFATGTIGALMLGFVVYRQK